MYYVSRTVEVNAGNGAIPPLGFARGDNVSLRPALLHTQANRHSEALIKARLFISSVASLVSGKDDDV